MMIGGRWGGGGVAEGADTWIVYLVSNGIFFL